MTALTSHSQYSGTAAQEMTCVVIGMEPQQIAMEYTKQEFISDGQDSVYFTAGEWGVQEEPDLNIGSCVPKLLT